MRCTPALPEDLTAAVADCDELSRWCDAAATAGSLEAFRAAVRRCSLAAQGMSRMPARCDRIELVVALPQHGLYAGMQGTVGEVHRPGAASEVECTDAHGQALALLALRSRVETADAS